MLLAKCFKIWFYTNVFGSLILVAYLLFSGEHFPVNNNYPDIAKGFISITLLSMLFSLPAVPALWMGLYCTKYFEPTDARVICICLSSIASIAVVYSILIILLGDLNSSNDDFFLEIICPYSISALLCTIYFSTDLFRSPKTEENFNECYPEE